MAPTSNEGQGHKVVMNMIAKMHGLGHIVVMDNFFSVVKLLQTLYALGTYATSNVKACRQELMCIKDAFKGCQQANFVYRVH